MKAPDHVASMMKKRRAWAEEAGLNQDIIEKLYGIVLIISFRMR